jgi:glucokinase
VIIAADIGGTKTNVALLEPPRGTGDANKSSVLVARAKYQSSQHPGLTAILSDFLATYDIAPRSVRRICAGVAGPVVEGHVETSNLPWTVDAAERAATLTESDVFVLNKGRRPAGTLTNGAVIAAGTGLGMALLHPIDGAWWPVASEGGHVELAARSELEMDLLRFLLKRHRRVSVERIVSGPGLVALYDFFIDRKDHEPDPEVAAQLKAPGADAPRIVSEAALEGKCPVANAALDQFVSFYGSIAGDLGLMAVSTGGMFVGGGIAPKILDRLKAGGFMESFTNKGRLSPMLDLMPVHVILDADAALMGAARRAVRLELGLVRG